jgi:ATP-dependent RNA helicase DeaD
MSDTKPAVSSFRDLNLPVELLTALDGVGYETPTPIQAEAIPHLLLGLDLLGHAPTGTGKTAAFALPLLARIDIERQQVQVLVLTPTRELAIQVAEAFQRYASGIKGFHVLPVYGGQDYSGQIKQLQRGVHVVVGTPGRVMDHMRKGILKLDALHALVLDEADEMLRMGFIDDVEWILEQMPQQRQMALFSATMPQEIQRIARRHLHQPQEIAIKASTTTTALIRQRYWMVSNLHKLDALTRILEVEPFDAVLLFVRTRIATTELAERLEARGYSAAALNGDMAQKQREQMIRRLKQGSLDILVATDVAARGLDVDRISHVVNYDIPYDIEAYIHRIGRTGRAGRQGDAILFVAPRERRMLGAIEQATRQKIEQLELPSTEIVNNKRIADFKQNISDTLAAGELDFMQNLLQQYQLEHDVPALEIAAALAKISIGDKPWLLEPERNRPERIREGAPHEPRPRQQRREPSQGKSRAEAARSMQAWRIDVGHRHGVKPGNIVGAIANEAELDARFIGNIDIRPEFSIVDLPRDMPDEVLEKLKNARVCGQRMNMSRSELPGNKKAGKRAPAGKRPGARKPGFDHPASKKAGPKKRPDKNKGAPKAKKRQDQPSDH